MAKKPEMVINGTDIAQFGARLIDYSVSGTGVTNNTAAGDKALLGLPLLASKSYAVRKLTVNLTITSQARGGMPVILAALTAQKAKLDSAIFSGDICTITLIDGYIYDCLVTSTGTLSPDGGGKADVTYTFDAILHYGMAHVTISNGVNNINCTSTTKTYCAVDITNVQGGVTTVSLPELGIRASIPLGKTLSVNGINKTVTMDGSNAFLRLSNFVDFPILKPGENTLTLSGDGGGTYTLRAMVSYYPVVI